MPRRKPEPAPKRKAARKSAPTKTPRDLARFTEATNAAARAALAPLTAEMEKLSRQITAQQSRALKDIAATLRAAAEAPATYALVLPTPTYALLARNATQAAHKAPDTHTYPAPYASQLTLGDEPQSERENYTRLLQGVSAPAQILLGILAGRWAELTHTQGCHKTHAQDGTCKHATRSVPFTLRALARDLYGSAGGKQVAQVSQLLEELQGTRIEYGTTEVSAGGTAYTAATPAEPLLRVGMVGVATTREESRDSATLQRSALFAKELHAEYANGSHKLIRSALLVGWRERWQQELALRLLTHPATWYGSRAMRRGQDGQSMKIGIGRRAVGELGAMAELLPSLERDPRAMRRRLEAFREELNSRSLSDELQIALVSETKTGRRVVGWTLGIGYPVAPLTGTQARGLLRAGGGTNPEERRRLAAYQSRRRRVLKQGEARTEVRQLVRETGLDTYQIPKEIPNTENTTEGESYEPLRGAKWVEADAIARYRRDWQGIPSGVRKHLQTRYPSLRDLPS